MRIADRSRLESSPRAFTIRYKRGQKRVERERESYAIADIRTRRVGAVLLRTRRVDAVGAVLEKEGDGLLSSIETINRRARWRLACYGKILERVS